MKTKRYVALLCVVMIISSVINIPLSLGGKSKNLIVTNLYQTSSMYDIGIDAENVRLGWVFRSTYRNVIQSAYCLQIRDDQNIVYDTGWVESSYQTGIKARDLKPETVYYWKVNVKDQKGNESGFSEEHTFETAPKALDGILIGGNQVKLLRTDFTLDQSIGNIKKARSYFASASLIETRLNGKKVGSVVLSPKKPVADKEIYYNTFDILPYLLDGKNSVGIMVSDVYTMGSSVIGMIKITYNDGTTQVIPTNTDWLASNTSPITRSNIFSGEDINLNQMEDWDTNDYKDKSKWKKAEAAGMTIKNGGLDVPSNSGSYVTTPTFKGDYTVEIKVSSPNIIGLLLGDSKPYPAMWQFTNNTIRKHQPGNWDDISVSNISPINLSKGAVIKLQIEGNTLKTYVNNRLLDTSNIPLNSTDGPIGFRSAPNESFNIDYIKVVKDNKVVFEDNFDYINNEHWNISIPKVKPAITGTTIIEEYKPIDIYEIPSKGSKPVYVVDFGKNMSGYVKLETKGTKGKSVTLKYSELVDENGEIFANTTFHFPQSSYTFTGNDDIFEPRFFYTGFRYIEVTGFDSMPSKDMFTACFVSDDVKQIGSFESSSKRLNDIYQLYYRAQRSNMVGNYTDCPQREKQGWTGDASVTKQSASLILNDYTTAEAYMKTMYMNIHEGRPSAIVPHLSVDKSLFEEFDIPWTSAYFTFPYFTYMQTGDPYYIEIAYDTLVDVFEYYKSTDDNGDYIVEYNRYGDWLGYDNQEGLLDRSALSASYFYYCGSLLSEMAKVIGRDNSELDEYLNSMFEALQAKYLKNNYFSTLSQTANSMALDFGIIPSNRKRDILQELNKKVKSDKTLRTGVLGTLSLYNAMSEANMHKELYDITVTDKKCSFGYMLDNGATTMWEYWDKAGETFNSNLTPDRFAAWDSQNHCMMGGGLTNWLYEGLGGITNIKAGYREILLRPGIESELTHVNCSIDTLTGMIESAWIYENSVLEWSVTVPENSKATVIIPIEKAKTITESGKNIFKKDGDGIKYIGKKEGSYVYEIGSGTYSFYVTESESTSVITWVVSISIVLALGILLLIVYLIRRKLKVTKNDK